VPQTTLFYQVNFDLFGIFAVASAILFITRRSPVAAALWLVNAMFSLAAMYVMLDAQFVGAVQILVYAGAIMVVFLFVVMLLNLGHADPAGDFRDKKIRFGAGALGVALLAELLVLTNGKVPEVAPSDAPSPNAPMPNAIAPVAQVLFTNHLLAFELTSVLLLVAIVGAVTLAKRKGGARA